MPIGDSFSPLRRVLVRAPQAEAAGAWRAYGWRAAPDPGRADQQHAAFRSQLESAGAEVVLGVGEVPGDPDAIYAYDPILITGDGAIALRPGKQGRLDEPETTARQLDGLGVPIVGALTSPAIAECGDMFWLDAATLLTARGYRTNDTGIAQVETLLCPEVEVLRFDLPHSRGPSQCLHLMSFISPLDRDLVVGFPPMMPVRLVELFRERDISIVEVPEVELDTMGPNVLALGPRVALALEGNPETRRRMEAAGVDVRTYDGSEISMKGEGGPTCLTNPLDRG